jgi:hypothetical protein
MMQARVHPIAWAQPIRNILVPQYNNRATKAARMTPTGH